jgi:tetratricopeptide (TPR) repeat protein
MLTSLLVIALILAALFAWGAVKFSRFRKKALAALDAVMQPHRRGDYEAQLESAEVFRADGEITAQYCFFRGSALAQLGRLDEAETWLRRNVAMHTAFHEKQHLAIGLTSLGEVLLQAGRYDEAQETFDESIDANPNRSAGYRYLAELCLLREADPADAVRWAQRAVQTEQAGKLLTEDIRNLNLGECLATLAWATAAGTHDAAEVVRLADAALKSVGSTNVESAAQVRCHLGRAFAELGDLEASARHYEEAARIDLQGHWGRVARSHVAV